MQESVFHPYLSIARAPAAKALSLETGLHVSADGTYVPHGVASGELHTGCVLRNRDCQRIGTFISDLVVAQIDARERLALRAPDCQLLRTLVSDLIPVQIDARERPVLRNRDCKWLSFVHPARAIDSPRRGGDLLDGEKREDVRQRVATQRCSPPRGRALPVPVPADVRLVEDRTAIAARLRV
jgi:hypothetical protein